MYSTVGVLDDSAISLSWISLFGMSVTDDAIFGCGNVCRVFFWYMLDRKSKKTSKITYANTVFVM
jgi:hypothetical protein